MEDLKKFNAKEGRVDERPFYKIGQDNLRVYNVEYIMEYLKNLYSDKFFLHELCSIIKEERVKFLNKKNDVMTNLFKEIGKDNLSGLLERTLRIENEGGIIRKDRKEFNQGRKTPGGVLMGIARKECGLTSQQKNKIFGRDNAYANQKKKIKKMMNKMDLS